MRRLLGTWMIFGGIWIALHVVTAILIDRRIALRQATFWTAALVPLLQAIAVESLAHPFGLGARLARMASALRRPAIAGIWIVAALALGAGFALPWAERRRAIAAIVAVLAVAAALRLSNAALRLRSARCAGLAAAALAGLVALWPGPVERLAVLLPGSPATARFAFLVVGMALVVVAHLAAARVAEPEVAADYFSGAAGAVVVAALLIAVPRLLGVPISGPRAIAATLVALVAATFLASGAFSLRSEREGS